MDSTFAIALLANATMIIVALIGAWATSGKQVREAVAPLEKKLEQKDADIAEQGVLIARLREKIVELKGDPDER